MKMCFDFTVTRFHFSYIYLFIMDWVDAKSFFDQTIRFINVLKEFFFVIRIKHLFINTILNYIPDFFIIN